MSARWPVAWMVSFLVAAGSQAGGEGREAPDPAAAAPAAAASAGAAQAPPSADASTPGSDCGEEWAVRVQARYDTIRDMRAAFSQVTRSVAFGQEAPAAGRVEFAKPGRMRWEYDTPEPSLVVSDGETLWIYDPTAGEAQVFPVGKAFLSAAAVQFLLGEGQLLESFHVSAQSCEGPRVTLELLPREESTYERLQLVVDEQGLIRKTTVLDLFGNRTEVRFDALEVDAGVGDDRFRFEAPEGVRVLGLPVPETSEDSPSR